MSLKNIRVRYLQFSTRPACLYVRVFVDGKPQFRAELTHEVLDFVWRFTTRIKLFAHASSVMKFCIYGERSIFHHDPEDNIVGHFEGCLTAFLDCAIQHRTNSNASPSSSIYVTLEVDYGATLQDASFLSALHQIERLGDGRGPHTPTNAANPTLSILGQAIQNVDQVMSHVENMVDLRAFCKVAWVMLMSIYNAVKNQVGLDLTLRLLAEELRDSLGLIWESRAVASLPEASLTIQAIIRLVIQAAGLIDEWIHMKIPATFDRRIHKFSWPEATSGNILGLSWAGQAAGRIHDCRNQLSGLRTLMAEAGSEAQRRLEQLQPLTPNDPLQRNLRLIQLCYSICDRGRSTFLEDPDAQRCIKTLSSILRDIWDIVKEQSHSTHCIGNRCLKAAKAITDRLEEWLCSAEAANTDGEPAVLTQNIAIAAVELIETDMRGSPGDVGPCYNVWRKMNHIRFMLCDYSLYIPQSVLLEGVRLKRNAHIHGVGSYADVYEGSFKGQRVAIKSFRFHAVSMSGSGCKMVQSFYREIAIQHGLSHPNICSFIGVTNEHFQGRTCSVMAWIEYASVTKFLEEQGFIPANVYRLLIEVVNGLCYLHQEGIAHGDLHPGNVLVDEWGHVKLSDFGMSNISDAELSIGTMRPGAMRYMAPEIHDPARYGLNHIRHTEKSDVYSFGHICWKIFTGIDPFSEYCRGFNLIMAVLDGRLPKRPPSDGPRDICDGLWDIMQKCWQRQPEDRPSMTDLQDELRNLTYSMFQIEVPVPQPF